MKARQGGSAAKPQAVPRQADAGLGQRVMAGPRAGDASPSLLLPLPEDTWLAPALPLLLRLQATAQARLAEAAWQ